MFFKVMLFSKKAKVLTNNSIHKTLKTTFTFILHHNQKIKNIF